MNLEMSKPVATTADVPIGTMRGVTVDGQRVLIANVRGEYLAVSGECTHDGGPLEEGELEDDTIVCPWHFSRFCLRSGEVIDDPAEMPIRSYRVVVADNKIQLQTTDQT